eukprot:CAMPEP_0170341194 /NCGR_PEP_ID=MMETSP0116_2-20130129/71716_1 /TAXON_ID=400756 /ORGANISM="Durinskia baltica, Strain CSIRO CS-38" /LENGTH=94 /DNA_ID=CAMNT_0010594735 /DNA_START=6 /DNA_END=286 /DNA_ORIENTATION=-
MSWYLANVDPEMEFELDHICHPYVDGDDKCRGPLARNRFTITDRGLISRDRYIRRRMEADLRLAEEDEREGHARWRPRAGNTGDSAGGNSSGSG